MLARPMHLVVRDLTMTYPNGSQALKGVSPDVPPGMFGLLRPEDRVRETLGYLPQSFGFPPRVSAERLLDHLAVLKGRVDERPRRDRRVRA